jgi:hypothetical protein
MQFSKQNLSIKTGNLIRTLGLEKPMKELLDQPPAETTNSDNFKLPPAKSRK